jgi:hypothetical protein
MADKIKAHIEGNPKTGMWIIIDRDDEEGIIYKLPIQKDEIQAIQNAIITWQSKRNLDRAIKKYKDKLKV